MAVYTPGLRARIKAKHAKRYGVVFFILLGFILFVVKPARIALGYLLPDFIRVEIADFYVDIWDEKKWSNTKIIVPQEGSIDSIIFLVDQDSFIVLKTIERRDSTRRITQFIRPTDLPIVAIQRVVSPHSKKREVNYLHRYEIYRKTNAEGVIDMQEETRLVDETDLKKLYKDARKFYPKKAEKE